MYPLGFVISLRMSSSCHINIVLNALRPASTYLGLQTQEKGIPVLSPRSSALTIDIPCFSLCLKWVLLTLCWIRSCHPVYPSTKFELIPFLFPGGFISHVAGGNSATVKYCTLLGILYMWRAGVGEWGFFPLVIAIYWMERGERTPAGVIFRKKE
jgi:hypothetical protein